MFKLFTKDFWDVTARLILRNKILILVGILLVTIFFSRQWENMRLAYSEANMLPDDHEVNITYNNFLKTFGEEGNLIVLGVKDSSLFTVEKLNAWNKLSEDFKSNEAVETVISIKDLQKLIKDTKNEKFNLEPFIKDSITSLAQIETLQDELFKKYPFYDNFLFNKETKTIRTAIYMDKAIVNTSARKDFVVDVLIPKIKTFENKYNLDVRVSGMPYIRTLNSQNIVDEINLFVIAALLVTSIIFFFFFRSFRATFISLIVVCIGVAWTLGIIGLLEYEVSVLTALIPPLIIVIGIPNCIFLINKYQHEVKLHGNKVKSLQRVITKIGNATLMTNVTTASGFATFILTESKLLKEFGIVASLSILAIFILCLLIIPIIYSFMPYPKDRHLEHLNKRWIGGFVNWMERMVRQKRIAIYITSLVLLVVSIIGIYQIKISGSLIEDMPQESDFVNDIRFFEEEFNGIMPLEILVDTKRKKGVMKLSTLKRMDALEGLVASGINPSVIIPGTGLCNLDDTVELSRHALELGCAGVMTLPPFYFKGVSDDGLFSYYEQLIAAINHPALKIYLYHIPQVSGVGLSIELVRRLRSAYPDVIVGIKDSSGVWDNTAELLKIEGLIVYPGAELPVIDAIKLGAPGCISATANLNPTDIAAVIDLCHEGRWDEAEALHEKVKKVRLLFQDYAPIPAQKALMAFLLGASS